MAPNGTTSRKTPSSVAKSNGNNDDDTLSVGNLFDGFSEGLIPKLKQEFKENLPIVKKPGNWDSDIVNGEEIKSASVQQGNVRIKKMPNHISRAFANGRPMDDKPAILRCNHCKRPVLEHAMPKHIESCLNKRQEKQRKKKEAKEARDAAARKERSQDSDDEDVLDGTAMKGGSSSKKRKAIDEGDDGGPNKKKKKKDEAKVKGAKPKAPVDVERQCGVDLPQGGQCARSLTCKSHSMGAKRAVPGRSAPYDKLLMEYQRKNQAKIQKAAMDASAPDPDDDSLPTGPIDEDEEKDAVVSSLARSWGGQPFYQKPTVPLQRKYEYNRVKSMLASALAGRNGGSLFGTFLGTGSLFGGSNRDTAMDLDSSTSHSRKSSNMQSAVRAMGAPSVSRKPSVASAVGA